MKNLKPQFDFDDILIVPKVKTHINSRYRGITLPPRLPLFTAPMDTVVDKKNYQTFLNAGIGVTLPRTIKCNDVDDVDVGVFDFLVVLGDQLVDRRLHYFWFFLWW